MSKCRTTSRRRTWQEVSLQRRRSNLRGELSTEQLLASVGSACNPDRLAVAVSRAGLADKEVDQLDSVVQGNLGTTVYLYIVRHCPPVLSNPTTEPSGNLAAGVMSGMVGSTASLAVPCFTVVCNGEVVGSGQVYVRPLRSLQH